eukprot:jgi/Orpsp1_1/1189536/evm.model.d7180000072701.1
MNSTINDFDVYSLFSYNDAIKYFGSLKCNSDNECPEKANCIGNKCITTFYCKNDHSTYNNTYNDDSKDCSLFANICDGKSCYKKMDECSKDEDCLSESGCSEKEFKNDFETLCKSEGCTTYYHDSDNSYLKKTCNIVYSYSVGRFTREDAKKYYE